MICFMSTLGKTFDEIVWHQHPWNVSRSSPGPAVFPSPQAAVCFMVFALESDSKNWHFVSVCCVGFTEVR